MTKFYDWYGYGVYHIIIVLLTVLLTVIIFSIAKKLKGNSVKIKNLVLWFGIFLFLLEVSKQIFSLFVVGGEYHVGEFPYLLCSTPIYIALTVGFVKNDLTRDRLYKYLGLFGLLGGLIVLIYPNSTLGHRQLFYLLHTMIWHSSMFLLGVFCIVSTNIGQRFSEVIQAYKVFLVLVSIATFGNIIIHYTWSGGPNLFSMSPFVITDLVVFSMIQERFSWFVSFPLYLFAIFLGGTLVWSLAYGIRKISNR